jgi:hypothetical protein
MGLGEAHFFKVGMAQLGLDDFRRNEEDQFIGLG